MFFFRLIKTLLSLYTLTLIVHFLLPYVVTVQKPWMVWLSKVCEPAERVGNNLAARLLPRKEYNVDMGQVLAIALCFILSMIVGWLA